MDFTSSPVLVMWLRLTTCLDRLIGTSPILANCRRHRVGYAKSNIEVQLAQGGES